MLLPYEHTGNKNSNILLIFLHGFPDTMRLWDQTITGIQKSDVQILNISYPNYHQSQNLKFGLDFPEVVKRIRSTIEHVDNGQNLKKLLITHDWGAFYGYLYDQKYPQTVDDIIALDVGAQVDLSLKSGLLIESYQITFAIAFLLTLIPIIGEFFGTLLARLYMKFILRIPIPQNYTAKINYPYFYFQKNLLFDSILNKSKKFLYRYKPSVPVVFIYGEKKPFQFHSARWQLTLSQNADSEFIAAKTGHWIQVEQSDLVINKIISRIARLKK
ncbi:unnamed protein product [Paramecium primaurelia]|uniref:AB hydrolase-1 domain-containing protein n=2 Tax=Paramecium TaxID=5884 RepID=A0A8S1TTJ3_9CILI|nr:unnamed protein product [Paramecium primaurelia]CAD8154867.1 unnamed protein product [Paramecium pentaurelia]